jgi:hypothetical protein
MPISPVKANPTQEKTIDTNKINLIKNQIKSKKSSSKSTPIKSDKKPIINSNNKNRSMPLKKDVFNFNLAYSK